MLLTPRATCSRRSTSSGGSSARSPAPTLRDRLLLGAHRRRRGAARTATGAGCATSAFDAGPVAQVVVDADGAGRVRQPAGRATLFGLAAARHRPPAPRPRALLPPGRAALAHRAGLRRAPRRSRSATSSGASPAASRATSRSRSRRCRRRRRRLLGVERHLPRRHRVRGGCRTSSSAPTASSRPPTRSCSRPNEELETTNEELQSTNEELETTNEELQSTNEELETMNEELQSTNEELQTINDELRERTRRARRGQRLPGGDPHQPAASASSCVDREQRVQVWNRQRRGPVGPARRRGARPALPQPRHRPAGRAAQRGAARRPQRRATRRARARRHQPPRAPDRLSHRRPAR